MCTYSTYTKPSEGISNFELCCTGGYSPVINAKPDWSTFKELDSSIIIKPHIIVKGIRNRQDAPVVGFCIDSKISAEDLHTIYHRMDVYNRAKQDIFDFEELV